MQPTATPVKAGTPQQPPQPTVDPVKMDAKVNGAAKAEEVVQLAISQIAPSEYNPRRTRNPMADTELIESIRLHGVQSPIVVMPTPSKPKPFHIVFGERRWDCSRKAGKVTVPAIVRSYTEAEAREVRIIENLHREGLDQIDEAIGMVELRDFYLDQHKGDPKYTKEMAIKAVGERMGMKPRTVYQMMKLAEVPIEVQLALRSDEISKSHVAVMAPYTPQIQRELLSWMRKQQQETWNKEFPSVRELKRTIEQQIHKSLDAAPFSKTSTDLVIAAGACVSCQKNTAVNANLNENEKVAAHPHCTDAVCYNGKLQAHLVQIEAAAKKAGANVVRISQSYERPTANDKFVPMGEWAEVKKGSCEHAVRGVIINGPHLGQTPIVCVKSSKCKTHWQSFSSMQREFREAVGPKQAATLKKTQEEKKKKAETEKKYRFELLKAVAGRIKLDRWLLTKAITDMLQNSDHEWEAFCAEQYGWPKPKQHGYSWNEIEKLAGERLPKMKEDQLAGVLVAALVCEELYVSEYSSAPPNKLMELAEHCKVDPRKVRSQLAASEKQKPSEGKTPRPHTSAKTRGKAKAARA